MRERRYELTEHDQITLGELIDALERAKPEGRVLFDWNGLSVNGLRSYRGYYDQLALGFSTDDGMNAGELLQRCKEAVGAIFEGYKGGSYRMDRNTRIYVANYGKGNGVGVVGIKVHDWGTVTLQTDLIDGIYKN